MAMDQITAKGAEQNYFRKRTVRIYTLCAALVLAVISAVAYALDFDPVKQVFKIGSALGAVTFYSALALTAIALIIPFIIVPKQKVEETPFPEENRYSHYYTTDNRFVLILRIVVCCVVVIEDAVRIAALLSGADKTALPTVAAVIMLMSALPLALYFVPEAVDRLIPTSGKTHLACGCFGLIWFVLNIVDRYFDKSVSLSSEFVTLNQISCIVIMLAIVYEIRYRLSGDKPRARLATSCAAAVIGIGLGLGQLAMLVSVGQVSYGATATSVTLLFIGLYFGARIFFYEED